MIDDSYKHYSHTSSGWAISTDPDAPAGRRWRAMHPEYGVRFFKEHDEILPFTCEHMVRQFMASPLYRGPKPKA